MASVEVEVEMEVEAQRRRRLFVNTTCDDKVQTGHRQRTGWVEREEGRGREHVNMRIRRGVRQDDQATVLKRASGSEPRARALQT